MSYLSFVKMLLFIVGEDAIIYFAVRILSTSHHSGQHYSGIPSALPDGGVLTGTPGRRLLGPRASRPPRARSARSLANHSRAEVQRAFTMAFLPRPSDFET